MYVSIPSDVQQWADRLEFSHEDSAILSMQAALSAVFAARGQTKREQLLRALAAGVVALQLHDRE